MLVIRQIKVDGTINEFGRKKMTIEEMWALVQTGTAYGIIEPVHLPGKPKWTPGIECMWVHEEGLVHSLPLNEKASAIAGQPIVGDVFIAEHEESDFNDD